MRLALIALAILISTPALADLASADRYSQEHRAWIASRVAATEKGIADQKALCARVGGVRIGLTAAGVLKSCWGKPHRVNTTQTASQRQEQWVYGAAYVYLTDGVVTAVQFSR